MSCLLRRCQLSQRARQGPTATCPRTELTPREKALKDLLPRVEPLRVSAQRRNSIKCRLPQRGAAARGSGDVARRRGREVAASLQEGLNHVGGHEAGPVVPVSHHGKGTACKSLVQTQCALVVARLLPGSPTLLAAKQRQLSFPGDGSSMLRRGIYGASRSRRTLASSSDNGIFLPAVASPILLANRPRHYVLVDQVT